MTKQTYIVNFREKGNPNAQPNESVCLMAESPFDALTRARQELSRPMAWFSILRNDKVITTLARVRGGEPFPEK